MEFLDLGRNLPLARLVYPVLDSIELEVEYRSIYGDRFRGRRLGGRWWVEEVGD